MPNLIGRVCTYSNGSPSWVEGEEVVVVRETTFPSHSSTRPRFDVTFIGPGMKGHTLVNVDVDHLIPSPLPR